MLRYAPERPPVLRGEGERSVLVGERLAKATVLSDFSPATPRLGAEAGRGRATGVGKEAGSDTPRLVNSGWVQGSPPGVGAPGPGGRAGEPGRGWGWPREAPGLSLLALATKEAEPG